MLFKTIKFATILLLIPLIYSAQANAERKKIILGGDYWCPYNCTSDSDHQGFLVDVVKKALYIYGIDVEYKMVPWHEALSLVKKGEIDGIIGVSNIQGMNVVTTNLPLEYSITSSFTRSDSDWKYDGLPSLKGKKIGIILDYTLGEDISNFVGINYTLTPGMFVIEDGKNAIIDSIGNLIDHKIDIYIEDQRVVNYYLKQHNLSSYIQNAGKVTSEKLPLYVVFNDQIPGVKDYVKFLEEGIASLKSTGEYMDLRAKYKMDIN